MPLIPFAQYGPDRSTFDAQFCDVVLNVMPLQGGYGPFPSFSPFSLPLPDNPMGTFLVYVQNGAYRLFVGSQTKLWMFDIDTLGWLDKSRPGGYNGAAGVRWSMAQFGEMLVCTNGADQPQWIDVNEAEIFADIPLAPKAQNVAAIGDFIMFSHLASNQRAVQWSGLNQPFFWTPRERSSDYQPFPDGGEIMATVSGSQGVVIFAAESIRKGSLALDSPLVFTFESSVPNHGCLAPRSVVASGAGIFYFSDDGFYKYGEPPVPIGVERIDRWFLENIQNSDIYDVYGGEDPMRKVVYWAFRSVENPVSGTYDRILLYHYGIDQWSLLAPGTILTGLLDATTPGYTLDGMNVLGKGIDQLPFSLDSRAWTGSTPLIAAFDQDRRLGYFAGEPMPAVIQTVDSQLTEGRRTMINGFRPLSDAATVNGRTATKEMPGGDERWRPIAVNNRTGMIPQITSGQFHRFEVGIPTQRWQNIHGVYPIDPMPDGDQ